MNKDEFARLAREEAKQWCQSEDAEFRFIKGAAWGRAQGVEAVLALLRSEEASEYEKWFFENNHKRDPDCDDLAYWLKERFAEQGGGK